MVADAYAAARVGASGLLGVLREYPNVTAEAVATCETMLGFTLLPLKRLRRPCGRAIRVAPTIADVRQESKSDAPRGAATTAATPAIGDSPHRSQI